MASDSAWVMYQVAFAARVAAADPDKVADLLALKDEVAHARSQCNKLRYLTKLMNHEKY
jgi:hypothetical protein